MRTKKQPPPLRMVDALSVAVLADGRLSVAPLKTEAATHPANCFPLGVWECSGWTEFFALMRTPGPCYPLQLWRWFVQAEQNIEVTSVLHCG